MGDFLTKRSVPRRQLYDVRNPQMWHLAEEPWMVGQLEELRLGVWAPQEGEAPPSLQERCGGSSGGEERGGVKAADITSSEFSFDEDSGGQEDIPDREDSPGPVQPKRSRRSGQEVQPAIAKKRRFDLRRDVEADSDEIEILTENISGRPLASLTSPSSSGLARLKARAGQLLSQSRNSATPGPRGLGSTPRGLEGTPRGLGSPLDAWLVRSPAGAQGRELPADSPESPEHIPGPAAVPPSPVRYVSCRVVSCRVACYGTKCSVTPFSQETPCLRCPRPLPGQDRRR